MLVATIDLGDLARARADVPLLADLRTALPHLRELLDAVDRDHVRPSRSSGIRFRRATMGSETPRTPSHLAPHQPRHNRRPAWRVTRT